MLALLFLLAAGTHQPAASLPNAAPLRAAKALGACTAVTRADIQSALGRTVASGNEENTANQSTCDYASPHGQVSVTIQHLATDPDLRAEIAALQREIEGSTARPAAALGARAFFLDIAGAGTQVHIVRRREYLLISILGFGEGEAISAAAEKLAQSAIGRM